MIKQNQLFLLSFLCIAVGFLLPVEGYAQSQDRPNILWIISEDNSPLIGAYGDDFATTPNIDKLADQGFTYTHAYANAPVCAPARNALITGIYPNSNGNQHMRSNYRATELVEFFPQLLQEAGYYVTNNAKEDYNIAEEQTEGIWDESSEKAHYKNREPGQPFFAVFNTMISHESSLFDVKPEEQLRHNPSEVPLPPYHPDTPKLRQQWAQYYDEVEDMDNWVGKKLEELEKRGLAENTIVFYYGDHGGVLPRSKRFVYESGIRVPLVIHIPEKYRHLWPKKKKGTEVNRLVSFVDFAPTILSIAGVEVSEIMQGRAFLGEQKTLPPEYAYMFRGRMDERYDMSRSVRSQRYRYIRNYMPYRMYGQNVDFLFLAQGAQSWRQTCAAGNCNEVQNRFWMTKPVEELYDTQKDPWEVNNLADDPAYQDVLKEMRKVTKEWMTDIKDTGVIPEYIAQKLSGGEALYDYLRRKNIGVKEWIDIANMAVTATAKDIPKLKTLLTSQDVVKRYWAATGLRIIGNEASSAISDLKETAKEEPSPIVLTAISEALYVMGERNAARLILARVLESSEELVRLYALNAIDSLDDSSKEIQDAVISMSKRTNGLQWTNRDHRVVMYLLEEWNIIAKEVGLTIDMGWIDNITP